METSKMVEKAREGDMLAFEALVKNYQSKVLGTAFLITKCSATAEEIAQDVFCRVYYKIHKLNSPQAFDQWLYTITVNLSRNALRKKKLYSVPLQEMIEHSPAEESTPESEVLRMEYLKEVRKAISDLDEKLRLPLILKYYSGLRDKEIAAVIKCPVGTVKSRLHSARAALSKILGEKFLGDKGGENK